jgi:hypothetical protein
VFTRRRRKCSLLPRETGKHCRHLLGVTPNACAARMALAAPENVGRPCGLMARFLSTCVGDSRLRTSQLLPLHCGAQHTRPVQRGGASHTGTHRAHGRGGAVLAQELEEGVKHLSRVSQSLPKPGSAASGRACSFMGTPLRRASSRSSMRTVARRRAGETVTGEALARPRTARRAFLGRQARPHSDAVWIGHATQANTADVAPGLAPRSHSGPHMTLIHFTLIP